MGKKSRIIIDPEFQALIPPLPDDEYKALEQSILRDGCRDALVVWNNILVDGHNRYEICKRIDKPFRTVPLERVATRDGAMAWMIDNQLARRNVNDFQRGELALKKEDLLAAAAIEKQKKGASQDKDLLTNLSKGPVMNTRRDLARAAGVSEGTLAKVKKIKASAAPELVEKVRSGEVKIDVAAQVASLPNEEQVALAVAGKYAMKAAAKEVRQASKRKHSAAPEVAVEAKESITDPKAEANSPPTDEVEVIRLCAENSRLRNNIKELAKTSGDRHVKHLLADALEVNKRLNGLCIEQATRIAVLEKEKKELLQRLSMQPQLDASIESRAEDAVAEQEADAVAVHAGCSLPSPLLDASVT